MNWKGIFRNTGVFTMGIVVAHLVIQTDVADWITYLLAGATSAVAMLIKDS